MSRQVIFTRVDAVHAAAGAAISRVTELMDVRRAGVATLDDWTGRHRRRFDTQFPASQADLAALIDCLQGLRGDAVRAAAVAVQVAAVAEADE